MVGGWGGYIGHLIISWFFLSARFAKLLRGHIGRVDGGRTLIKTWDASIRQFKVCIFHRHSHQGTHPNASFEISIPVAPRMS